jgi:hypothetical protein
MPFCHLAHIFQWVKIVGVSEGHPQLFGQLNANCRLSATRNAQDYDHAHVFILPVLGNVCRDANLSAIQTQ